MFYERTVTLVTAKSVKLLLCVRVHARAREGCYSFFIIRFSIVPTPLQGKNFQPVIWWKTTCRSMKSDLSFYEKRPVIFEKWPVVLWKETRHFWKVTCRFMKSDLSFYEKWPVGFWKATRHFWKTTCRFIKNKPSFLKSDPSFYEKQAVILCETSLRFFTKIVGIYNVPERQILTLFSIFDYRPANNILNIPVFYWYSAPYRKTVTLVTAKKQHRC